jgi:hypothetical protein
MYSWFQAICAVHSGNGSMRLRMSWVDSVAATSRSSTACVWLPDDSGSAFRFWNWNTTRLDTSAAVSEK